MQRHDNFLIYVIGNGPATAGMIFFAARFFWIDLAFAFLDPEWSCLAGCCLFQLLQAAAHCVIAIVEILDLLMEVLNFLPLFFNDAGLSQNNFDEPIGLLAQRLQVFFERR